jgi:hypothetical protein
MSISSTRKISSSASNTSRIDRRSFFANNHSQHVENIDTTNNVLVKEENDNENRNHQHHSQEDNQSTSYKSSNPNILNGIEAIASSIDPEEQGHNALQNQKIDIYSNNQSIIHDDEIEHTGRNYLKHFYEKNEHMIDIDELV